MCVHACVRVRIRVWIRVCTAACVYCTLFHSSTLLHAKDFNVGILDPSSVSVFKRPCVLLSLLVSPAWCLRSEGVSSVLLGVSNTEQLVENLGALRVMTHPLTAHGSDFTLHRMRLNHSSDKPLSETSYKKNSSRKHHIGFY